MAQEAQEPRLQKYKGRYYIHFRDNNRSQRVSTRTDDLAIATARFQGWLDKSKINFQVENDPTIGRCLDLWFNDLFKWLDDCEKIFGFEKLKGYETKRLYAYLAERYLSFWFNKYTKVLNWHWSFFDPNEK